MAKATKKKAAAKKSTAKKPAAKKAAAKKPAAKKAAATKTTAKKAAAKKTTSKAAAKKSAPKKSAPKKDAAKKTVSKKAAPKKEAAKKAAPKKEAKKAAPKKAAPKKVAAKKAIAKKAEPEVDDSVENEDRPIKVDRPCPYSKSELKEWRDMLKQRYSEVSGDIKDLIHDAMDSEDGHTLPTHQADRGSDVDLQDLSLGMLDDEETLLWQIERALHKIDTGSPIAFGLCEHSYDPIPEGRLRLLPWTPLSIEGAGYMEEHGLTLHDMIIDE